MSQATDLRTGVTVRLTSGAHARLRRIAEAEHRSVAGYLELLVERELAARDDAERVVHVHVASELADLPQGTIRREAGEGAARYKRRRAALARLFGESWSHVPAAVFAEGTFVWTLFPFGPPNRPDIPGPVRHIAYVLASRGDRASAQLLLAYTSSGPWRGAAPQPPPGIIEFDQAMARRLNQRSFHIDLRCLARVPLTAAWFPDLASPDRGVVAVAGARVRDRILKVAELLAARSPRIIEIRGI